MIETEKKAGNQKRIESREKPAWDEDHITVRLVLNESVNAYEILINKYQAPIYNLFLRMLHNREEAEELTQETFVKAYEALPGFRFEYRFFSWLYRIAVNLALNDLKKQKRFVGSEYLKNIPDEKDDKTAENKEHMKWAVDQLKDIYKAVIVLKYYQQLSYQELAFALNIPEKKVRSRLYDARLQLKTFLERSNYY
ncbi:MAG: RNA polymerase sigma factor [Bacteroidetes bacterium]|nr:RNA polymerase sigma factor [Bacteroidota bacterium]